MSASPVPRPLAARSGCRALKGAALLALLGAAACQSSPAAHSGFLSTYEGLGRQADGTRGPVHRRDDAASDQVSHVYIAPAVLKLGGPSPLNVEEEAMLLSEVDRQICFEVSERFTIVLAPSPEAGTIRTAIVRIDTRADLKVCSPEHALKYKPRTSALRAQKALRTLPLRVGPLGPAPKLDLSRV